MACRPRHLCKERGRGREAPPTATVTAQSLRGGPLLFLCYFLSVRPQGDLFSIKSRDCRAGNAVPTQEKMQSNMRVIGHSALIASTQKRTVLPLV